jgi:hypothetical protein
VHLSEHNDATLSSTGSARSSPCAPSLLEAEILQFDAFAVLQAPPGFLNPLEEATVIFQPVIKPFVIK